MGVSFLLQKRLHAVCHILKKKTKLTQYVPFSGNSIALYLDVLEAMLRTPMCLTKQT